MVGLLVGFMEEEQLPVFLHPDADGGKGEPTTFIVCTVSQLRAVVLVGLFIFNG